MTRRQLAAFLPPPFRSVVDAVRQRWDPVMAERIGAHLTIVHELPDVPMSTEELDTLTACAPIEIRIGDVKCWGEPSAGIYLSVEDPTGSVARIRQALAIVEPPGLEYVPHITLTHPRTTDAARSRAAWEHLATWRLDQHVLIDAVAVIELRGSTWETTGSVRLSR